MWGTHCKPLTWHTDWPGCKQTSHDSKVPNSVCEAHTVNCTDSNACSNSNRFNRKTYGSHSFPHFGPHIQNYLPFAITLHLSYPNRVQLTNTVLHPNWVCACVVCVCVCARVRVCMLSCIHMCGVLQIVFHVQTMLSITDFVLHSSVKYMW